MPLSTCGDCVGDNCAVRCGSKEGGQVSLLNQENISGDLADPTEIMGEDSSPSGQVVDCLVSQFALRACLNPEDLAVQRSSDADNMLASSNLT